MMIRKCQFCDTPLIDYRSTHCRSHSKMEGRNPKWKGKKVGYTQLHTWVKSRLPKPSLCQDCGMKPPYDLANKGIYNRELINWEWLCRSCHMKKDGRIERLHSKENYVKSSNSLKGRTFSEEHRKNLSKAAKLHSLRKKEKNELTNHCL